MKGGADIDDQMAISRAVTHAKDGVLDVTALAASLNIPLECCQSFVDFYAIKNDVVLKTHAEAAPAPKKAAKEKAEKAEKGEERGFFG